MVGLKLNLALLSITSTTFPYICYQS